MNNKRLLISLLLLLVFSCKNPDIGTLDHLDKATESDVAKVSKTAFGIEDDILAYYGFDDGLGNWYETNMCCDWSATFNKSIRRAGSSSVKFELRKGDMTNGPRAELGQAPSKEPEGWYAFSMYFPDTFAKDPLQESIVQWQAKPDLAAGENWRSPPLAFCILNDRFVLDIRSDSKKITTQGDFTFNRIDLGPVDKMAWMDWAFHIKWAHDKTGVIEVWKNQKLVLSRRNEPNSYNDEYYPYFKIGIYKWEWADNAAKSVQSSRAVYVDEVRLGSLFATLESISPLPSGGSLPVTLISFTATKKTTNTQLSWSTASEVGADRFILERSTNAKDWKGIAETAAAGESSAIQKYSLTHSNPTKGANYYRLKMIDKDGTIDYSTIRNVNF